MNSKTRALWQVHLAVLILGLAGLFGRLTTLSVFILILGRTLFSSLSLFGLLKYQKQSLRLKDKKDYIYLALVGIILCAHWLSFFHSINVSTVAIGLLTFSSFPIFVILIEPYLFKEKLHLGDLIPISVALFGIILIIPSFDLNSHLTQGALWGLVSSVTYAAFSLGNKKITSKYPGPLISFYEQLTVFVVLIPSYFILKPKFTTQDIFLIILMGTFFTAFAHTLIISALKHIKAKTSSMIFCLEPLYSILAAAYVLHELPSPKTIIGGVIVLGAVFYSTKTSKK